MSDKKQSFPKGPTTPSKPSTPSTPQTGSNPERTEKNRGIGRPPTPKK